jgi:hypothetical protein
VGRLFWALTQFVLRELATFDDQQLTFSLHTPPVPDLTPGTYHLISKTRPNVAGEFLYRLSHPLGEHVIETGKRCATPVANVVFNVSGHHTRITVANTSPSWTPRASAICKVQVTRRFGSTTQSKGSSSALVILR